MLNIKKQTHLELTTNENKNIYIFAPQGDAKITKTLKRVLYNVFSD